MSFFLLLLFLFFLFLFVYFLMFPIILFRPIILLFVPLLLSTFPDCYISSCVSFTITVIIPLLPPLSSAEGVSTGLAVL